MKFIFYLYIFLLLFITGIVVQSVASPKPGIPQTTNNNFRRQTIDEINFCNFVMYGDDMRVKLGMKHIFGYLPDSIFHLPLAHSEEDFPIKYWLHVGIPEDQRSLVDQAIEETNSELGFRAFTIEGIDYSEIDPIDNRKDQKNVIYWLDKEEMSTAMSIFASNFKHNFLLPGFTVFFLDWDTLNNVSYPILDTDINIDANFTTDLEALRSYLVAGLKLFGVESPPLNTSTEDMRDMLKERLENIDIEEYRELLIENLTQIKQSIRQTRNEMRDEIGLSEAEEMSLNQLLTQIDTVIFRMSVDDSSALATSAEKITNIIASINIARFQDSSSVSFKSLLKHELLHTLGLDHYKGPIFEGVRPLMAEVGLFVPEDILTPGEVDFYAERSLSCIYDLDSLRQRYPL